MISIVLVETKNFFLWFKIRWILEEEEEDLIETKNITKVDFKEITKDLVVKINFKIWVESNKILINKLMSEQIVNHLLQFLLLELFQKSQKWEVKCLLSRIKHKIKILLLLVLMFLKIRWQAIFVLSISQNQ